MLKRIYGNIKSVADLSNLQEEASAVGLVAVGVTDSGSLFKLSGFSSVKLTNDEAKEILQVTDEQLEQIIKHRGAIELLDNEVASSTPVVEESKADAPSDAANTDEPNGDETSKDDSESSDDEDSQEDEEETHDFIQISKEEYDDLLEQASKAVQEGNLEISQSHYDELVKKASKFDEIIAIINQD